MQSKILTSCLMIGVLSAGVIASYADQANAPAATPVANSTTPSPGTNNAPPRMRPLPSSGATGPMAVLSEEQRASYQKNLADQRPQMMELNSKIQAARQGIMDDMFSLKVDENKIREKVIAEAQIEAEMAILQAKAFADIQPPLTPEELDKFKEARTPRPMMRPMQTPPTTPSNAGTNHVEPPRQ